MDHFFQCINKLDFTQIEVKKSCFIVIRQQQLFLLFGIALMHVYRAQLLMRSQCSVSAYSSVISLQDEWRVCTSTPTLTLSEFPFSHPFSSPPHWPTFPLTCFRKDPHTPSKSKMGERGRKKQRPVQRTKHCSFAKSHLAFVLAAVATVPAPQFAGCSLMWRHRQHFFF